MSETQALDPRRPIKTYPDGKVGDYFCTCFICGLDFIGHKLDRRCPRPHPEFDSETEEIRTEWESVKASLDPSGWTVGESATYYGFFVHGFRTARRAAARKEPNHDA